MRHDFDAQGDVIMDVHASPKVDRADDHALAAWLATVAGERLLEVREEGFEGRALKDAGDLAAHNVLMALLAEHRPSDAVLSEEGKDDPVRLRSSRVWIVDPLDGTREFSEPPRDDWAVHVALWQDGELVAGAVAQPGLRQTFSTGQPSQVPPRAAGRPRIAVSRTRPPAFVDPLAAELGADLVPMGSAGLFTSRIDGSPLIYNREDPTLPDLIVCRPELSEQILDFIARHGI
jgi:3'(2'), 5'-bisphosphate nucleotidase